MIRFGKGNLRIPRFEKPVFAVAGGLTDFRKKYPEKNAPELVMEATRMAFEENDLKVSPQEVRERVNWVVYLAVRRPLRRSAARRGEDARLPGLRSAGQHRSEDRRRHGRLVACSRRARRWRPATPTACPSSAGSAWTKSPPRWATATSPRRRARTSNRTGLDVRGVLRADGAALPVRKRSAARDAGEDRGEPNTPQRMFSPYSQNPGKYTVEGRAEQRHRLQPADVPGMLRDERGRRDAAVVR